ncbi:MAG: hypothetical protein ACKVE3_08400 [Dissulfuribacterales bacterium]
MKKIYVMLLLMLCFISTASAEYTADNKTLTIYNACDIQYHITTDTGLYGGKENIDTVVCDDNVTVVSGWFKIYTTKSFSADYTFMVYVNGEWDSRIVTINQTLQDSSIISRTFNREISIDGIPLYNYNTTVYKMSIIPNPIYFSFSLEDQQIQFGKKIIKNQILAFTQLNLDDQYEFLNTSGYDRSVTMKFKSVDRTKKTGFVVKGLTGAFLNIIEKIPFVGKSLRNILYLPMFFVQVVFNFGFTFLSIIVDNWWYALLTLEIFCNFSAARKNGYADVMDAWITTHVKIIQFVYEHIILTLVRLIIRLIDMIIP